MGYTKGKPRSDEAKEKRKNTMLSRYGTISTPGFAGHSHSKEAREHIRQGHLGKPKSQEHREKIAAAHRGKPKNYPIWNKGRVMPLAERQALSERMKGKSCLTLEQQIKQREASRKAHLGKTWSEDRRKQLSASLRNSPKNSKRKENIQKAHQNLWENPEYAARRRKEISASLFGKEKTVAHRHKLSLASKKRWSDSKYASHMRDAIRKTWANPEHVKKMFRIWSRRPNKVETRIDQLLIQYWPNDWKYVGDGQCVIGGKLPDFINVNGKKAIIEVFGRYWHKKTDAATRTKHFKRYGFKTLCVWEDITDDQFIKKVNEKFYMSQQSLLAEKP